MTQTFAAMMEYRKQLTDAGVSIDTANMMLRCISDYQHTQSDRAKLRVINSLPTMWSAVFSGNEVQIIGVKQS